ncbi:prephenate dehydratase domain-containing protein [Streptomyces sp. DSM 44917]|uniref:Prephenate dehydratase n=1 Tax=Streptomyces boetiae TaxID=3075541 RepID=A0ABU2LEZ4_9ACTN|nr:prephenate dehydratase domain-containing protein [Streptomyces sp. DSM 44917]MDT0310141.1 prephenate dehydratase domain-containing protein [Streptomyces sp. DSM 44917]
MKNFSGNATEDPVGAVGYLGPPGTFTHQATLTHPALAERAHIPLADAESVIGAVARGSVELGVLAWESSVAGLVGPTLDLLAASASEVRIRDDIALPVEMCLWTRPGARLGDVRRVASHAHALTQCRGWLRAHLPAATVRETASTAAALEAVARDRRGTTAAIASAGAGNAPGVRGVTVSRRAIGDIPDAVTRFVVLGLGAAGPREPRRALLACFQPQNRPGSLLRILRVFADHGIELTHIESRPTRTGLGHYYFLVECLLPPSRAASLERAAARLRGMGVRVKDLGATPFAPAGRSGAPGPAALGVPA